MVTKQKHEIRSKTLTANLGARHEQADTELTLVLEELTETKRQDRKPPCKCTKQDPSLYRAHMKKGQLYTYSDHSTPPIFFSILVMSSSVQLPCLDYFH